MMRTAKLREGNSNKVVIWTGTSYEYDDVIELSCVWTVPKSNLAPKKPHPCTVQPGADRTVNSTGEELFQVEEAFRAIQEHDCCEERETTIARGTEPMPVFFFMDFGSIRD